MLRYSLSAARIALATSIGLSGCNHDNRPPAPGDSVMRASPSAQLPSVTEQAFKIEARDQPDYNYYALEVSDAGLVSYVLSRKHEPVMVIVDTTGRRVASFGSIGEGPGEFTSPTFTAVLGDTLFISNRNGVISAYSWKGEFLREFRPAWGDIMLGIVEGAVIQANINQSPVEVLRASRTSLRQDRMFLPSQSLLTKLLAKTYPGNMPFGGDGEYLAIGDGFLYRIDVYNNADQYLYQVARDVEPSFLGPRGLASAEKGARLARAFRGPDGEPLPGLDMEKSIKELRTTPMPHFSRSAFFFDGKRRLWVMGRNGDSVFADIFADTVFLGRILFPCYSEAQRRALTGKWLVMECIDGPDSENVLHLYRIDDVP